MELSAAGRGARGPGRNANTAAWVGAHLLFLALLLACFSPVWFQGRLLAPMDILSQMYLPWRGDIKIPEVHNHFVSDAVTQYIPYRWFAHQSLRADGYVGWNNLNYGGTPQYANTMTTSFDWTLQLSRWLDFWDAWHIGIFLQFLLAGCGMLIFLRSQEIGPLAGLLGAICYAGNFQFIAWIYHRWALGSFCWMPLVLWSLVPLIRLPWNDRAVWRTIPWTVFLAPFLLCAAFFGGTLQHATFVIVSVGCLGLAAAVGSGVRPLAWMRSLTTFAVVGILGVGLAWIMFSPCIASFLVNQTATSRAQGFGYPGGLSQPLFNLIVYPFYAFPWPLGSPDTLDLWKAFKTDLFNVPYIGFLPAILAIAGIFSKRVPLAPKLLMVVGFLLPLTPLVAPLYHRVYLVGILGAVWAACVFVDAISREEVRRCAIWLLPLFAGASFLWLVAGIVVAYKKQFLGEKLGAIIEKTVPAVNFEVFPQWFLSRGGRYLDAFPLWSSHSFVPWLLALCGCALLLAYALRKSFARPLLIGSISLLAVAELIVFAGRWVTFSPASASPIAESPASPDLYPAAGILASVRAQDEMIRLYTEPSIPFQIPFPPNTLGTYGIATLRGYDSIQDKIMEGVGAPYQDSPFLPALAVTHALASKPLTDPRWRLLDNRDGVLLYKFTETRPRYEASGGGSESVELPLNTQNHRLLEVASDTARIRVSENWHEGWRYRVGSGPWLSPKKNQDLSMDLEISASGTETIEMRFSPRFVDNSVIVSLVSLAAVIVLAAVWIAKCRRPGTPFTQ